MTQPLTKRRPGPPVPPRTTPKPAGAKPAAPGIPLPGLASAEPEVKKESGSWGSTKSEDSYDRTANGVVSGTRTQKSATGGVGAMGSRETSTDVFDGKTSKKSATSVEGLAGLEAAIKTVRTASKEELKAAYEAKARGGAMGSASAEASVKRGKASASASGAAEGGVGFQASSSGSATVDRSGLVPALELVFEASGKAGIWASLDGEAKASIGPALMEAKGHAEAFIGVSAEIALRAFANAKEGIGVEGSAGARAVATASADAEVSIGIGNNAMIVKGGVLVWAGAEVAAEGAIKISLTGITVSGKASAMAGIKLEASGSAVLKLAGRTILSAEGSIGVVVGAGVEIEGTFSFNSGKLKIGGKLAAALKGGATVGGLGEIDFLALGEVIAEKVEGAYNSEKYEIGEASPSYVRAPIDDPALAAKQEKKGYTALIDDFSAYGRKKGAEGKVGVKRERVQEIIQARAVQLREDLTYTETDKGIERAAREAFGPMLKDIVVQAGRIRAFQVADEATVADAKKDYQKRLAERTASDALAKDLTTYGVKKSATGKAGVKKENIQKILDNHYPKLVAAFETGGADAVIKTAVDSALGEYLTTFIVTEGKIRGWEAPEAKATAKKQGHTDDQAAGKRAAAVAGLRTKLVGYKAGVLGDQKKTVTRGELDKLLAAATSKSGDATAEFDAQLASVFNDVLSPIVDAGGIQVSQGRITALTLASGGLDKARKAKDDATNSDLQGKALTALTSSLAAYKEKKTGQGAVGIKREQVQKRIDKATEKVKPYVASGEADDAIKKVATEALSPLLRSLDVAQGQIVSFDAPAEVATQEKRDRKENGKARLGGAEDDNMRRRMVADAVRPDFTNYAASVRAAYEKAAQGKPPAKTLEMAKLQSIVTKRIKIVRADVVNEVGDEALQLQAEDSFGPMLSYITFNQARITSFAANPKFAEVAKAKRSESANVRQVVDDLTSDLRVYAATIARNGGRPSKSVVQAMLAKHRPKLNGLDDAEVDQLLSTAVHNALGKVLETLTIEAGQIKEFSLAAAVAAGTP